MLKIEISSCLKVLAARKINLIAARASKNERTAHAHARKGSSQTHLGLSLCSIY